MNNTNKINDYSLYLVISEECAKGRNILELTQIALDAGVDIVQLREKKKTKEELVGRGKELLSLCRKKEKTFIVNDDPYLAKEIGADGVHMGQEDIEKLPLPQIRKIIGNQKLIGISTHSFEQFKEANRSSVDYISFGPIFCTPTKNYCIGTDDIGRVLDTATKPVFFIGGINLSNVNELLRKRVKNIALIRAILEAKDVQKAAAAFKEKLRQAKGGYN
ncbi:MAG: thiamine phosphate synthase [Candidatus Omnitrophota bacterium]|nr:thiamine phosphate synthase [Candidatus Omnitrophota bacterium]